MKVLVTFAVEAEFAPWRKLRTFHAIDYYGLRLWRTDAGGVEITALVTGMGHHSAARAMGLMMRMADDDRYFDVCVSSGLAGALRKGLAPGDIIVPQFLIVELAHPELSADRLDVDQDLRNRALHAGAISADCLFTTDRVFVKASQKQGCSSKAQSVDMESFEIVKEATAWGARAVVVRAISDTVDEDLPINFNRTLSKTNRISLIKVMRELMKNPLALPALIRFGKQSRNAAQRLADFLDVYVPGLSAVARGSLSNQVKSQ